MEHIDFKKRIETILEQDHGYPYEAYVFLNAAVKFTIDRQNRENDHPGRRHINASELLDGVVAFAQEQFGPMAAEVLRCWRLEKPTDVGRVTFNMVNARLLSRSDDDNEADFELEYDLDGKLRLPYSQTVVVKNGTRVPIIA